MYLKRLELFGFKSFAEKTVLEFPAGIAAVVGPNGSGKSNIIDAIRWLMGEREAKNMRSLKAEDLIFAGTEARSRVSLAQATMVFDNSSKFFPVDYSEVSIKRRLSRDGTSEHFLNDSEVRLKDVIDFFAKSRLGTKGFSIVNQGDSDLFVRSSPVERRNMLEEILGLRQFQLKKHDAELKLKNTRFNMEKTKALIDELLPHLKLLRRQASRFEKHGELIGELEELEINYFGFKLQELESDLQKLTPQFEKIDHQSSVLSKELKHLEEEFKKVDSKSVLDSGGEKWRKERDELLVKKADFQKEIGRLEAQIEIVSNEPESQFDPAELIRLLEEARETIQDILLESDIKTVRKLLNAIYEKINSLLDSEDSFKSGKSDGALDDKKADLLEELEKIDKKLLELREAEEQFSSGVKNFNEAFRKAFESLERKKSEMSSLEQERQKLLFNKERISIRREELNRQAEQFGKRLNSFNAIQASGEADFGLMERRMLKLRSELAGIGEIDPGLIKEAEETEVRYQFLSGQLEDLEKASKDLSRLIKELENRIHDDFVSSMRAINEEFHKYFRMMFGGGQAKMVLQKPEIKEPSEGEVGSDLNREANEPVLGGIEIIVTIPRKRITGLDMLSGGEKSLVSLAALFALISVSPPPFLVMDEVDAALDENNSRRFSSLIKEFSKKTQFLLVTHNRSTMESADILYGITMGDDGTSRVLSLKL